MYKVGFNGGGTLVEVGDVSAMEVFFEVVRAHVATSSDTELATIVDRLYRRYVRLEDVALTRLAVAMIRTAFASLPLTVLDGRLSRAERTSGGILDGENDLASAFSRYFYAIEQCIDSAEVNLRHFKARPEISYEYEPVLIIRSEVPAFFIDKRIKLSAYDELKEEPFWLQPSLSANV
jgi:hypothetical protein